MMKTILTFREMPDAQLDALMLDQLLPALGNPPPLRFPEGHVLVNEGAELQHIWLLLKGKVRLYRTTPDHDIVFHQHTAGRIIGILALAHGGGSFFNCRTVTPVEVLPVTLVDLDRAIRGNEALENLVAAVVIRSLARRSRRAVELQLELDEAQTRLVKNEKMATLGQLVAGLAHELNNPIAAITRTVAHLGEDLAAVVDTMPDAVRLGGVMQAALLAAPLGTKEERALRRRLGEVLKDEEQARRLVRAGITTAEEADRLLRGCAGAEREARIEAIERFHRLGGALRNLGTCARRIEELVRSLRSYARPENEFSDAVDLHVGIEDTLLLFGHALRGIQVVKQFGALPAVACNPGEINQVWTNLISNAIEAMQGRGTLRIETQALKTAEVSVRVLDDGSGIDPAHMHRIFDVNFTTRQGPAAFGLGIGLPICKEIVERHQGHIRVKSRPGHTCFDVRLPVVPARGNGHGGKTG